MNRGVSLMSREPHVSHVSNEEIARLAEGTLPAESAESILAHLSRCRSCMAAYVEAVRYRAAWLAEPDAFKPPKDVLERGRAVLRRGESQPRRARPRTWPRRALAAGGSLAALWA